MPRFASISDYESLFVPGLLQTPRHCTEVSAPSPAIVCERASVALLPVVPWGPADRLERAYCVARSAGCGAWFGSGQ